MSTASKIFIVQDEPNARPVFRTPLEAPGKVPSTGATAEMTGGARISMSDDKKRGSMEVAGPASPAATPGEYRFAAMADRLGRLERACRRWRLAGLGLGTCLMLLLGMAAVLQPRTIEAERFILKDAEGVTLAAWAMSLDHTPGICLFDRSGKPRLSLDLARDGAPGVNLYNPDGSLRAALAVRPDGTPGLGLADARGQIRLSVDLGNDGSSGFNLFGETGALRAALAIRPDGTPALGLFDENGTIRRSFEIGSDGGPAPRREDFEASSPRRLETAFWPSAVADRSPK